MNLVSLEWYDIFTRTSNADPYEEFRLVIISVTLLLGGISFFGNTSSTCHQSDC
jgi:hypothetical protein